MSRAPPTVNFKNCRIRSQAKSIGSYILYILTCSLYTKFKYSNDELKYFAFITESAKKKRTLSQSTNFAHSFMGETCNHLWSRSFITRTDVYIEVASSQPLPIDTVLTSKYLDGCLYLHVSPVMNWYPAFALRCCDRLHPPTPPTPESMNE